MHKIQTEDIQIRYTIKLCGYTFKFLSSCARIGTFIPPFIKSVQKNLPTQAKSNTLKKIVQNALAVLKNGERNKFNVLTVLNLLLSLADIVILALLLAVVSLYTGTDNTLLHLLPSCAKNSASLLPIVSLLLLFGFKNLFGFWLFRTQSQFFFSISSRLSRKQLFNYLNGSYEEYVQAERAQILNSVNHRPIEFAQNILTSIQTVVTESALVVITILAILILKPLLVLLLILFLLPPVIVAALLMRNKMRHVKNSISKDAEKTSQYLNESFSSFIESNIYNKKAFFADRHLNFQRRLSAHVSQLQIMQWIPNKLVEVFAVLGLFVLVLFNKFLGNPSGLLDIGTFIAAAYKIMPGIVRITNASALLKTYEYIVAGLPKSGENKTQQQSITLQTIQSITFSNVDFGYKNNTIFRQFNTEMQCGDFVFISGPSGKGKTTFINLLLGFLAPREGTILFNGIAVAPADIKRNYSLLAYVPQQSVVIQDTIQTNITLEEDNVNKEQLLFAVESAGLNPLINRLKDGLQTILADEAKDISGGQKQRIAIARALYRNAAVIVLDEPFNELDKESEVILLKQFKALALQGKLIILIAHNTLGLEYCNKHLEF